MSSIAGRFRDRSWSYFWSRRRSGSPFWCRWCSCRGFRSCRWQFDFAVRGCYDGLFVCGFILFRSTGFSVNGWLFWWWRFLFLQFVCREISRATQPHYALWIRRSPRCDTPADQSRDKHDVGKRDQHHVSPELGISRHVVQQNEQLCLAEGIKAASSRRTLKRTVAREKLRLNS